MEIWILFRLLLTIHLFQSLSKLNLPLPVATCCLLIAARHTNQVMTSEPTCRTRCVWTRTHLKSTLSDSWMWSLACSMITISVSGTSEMGCFSPPPNSVFWVKTFINHIPWQPGDAQTEWVWFMTECLKICRSWTRITTVMQVILLQYLQSCYQDAWHFWHPPSPRPPTVLSVWWK